MNNDIEINCKYYISKKNYCNFYKKAYPPQKVCEICNHFDPCEVIRDCYKFKSRLDEYCCNSDSVRIIYRKRPDACKYCQWPEKGRFELFNINTEV